MPEVLRDGPYKVVIYFHEPNEAPHVHVERDGRRAKFWLSPLRVESGGRFKQIEMRRIHRMLDRRLTYLLERWRAIHG